MTAEHDPPCWLTSRVSVRSLDAARAARLPEADCTSPPDEVDLDGGSTQQTPFTDAPTVKL